MAIKGVTTTIVNGILSCLHSNARFIRGKSWKINLFPTPVGEITKTSILPTTYFKQFLCSSRLASTLGKSLSAVFAASSNSGRDAESVITALSHFSLWSKTLLCWQKLSKSTNQRVYQDLVYRNALLLKILTSVPAPLSPVPLYFSSLSHCSPLSERLEQASAAAEPHPLIVNSFSSFFYFSFPSGIIGPKLPVFRSLIMFMTYLIWFLMVNI